MRTISELLTQEELVAPEPIKEFEFYEGYRKRLKIKLDQKIKQIVRIERILPTISEEERKTFITSLSANTEERDEIQLHLDQVEERIKSSSGSKE
jgi:hypothetical protein